ncbi:MAG: 4Fe-4S dicluster domain-containing protein [Pseudomonadota bacterium]
MIYEFKVNQLAEEFGVHRNTVRNWINAGVLAARKGPGRKYLMQFDDYRRFCEKFGRDPSIHPGNNVSSKALAAIPQSDLPRLVLSGAKSRLAQDPSWADACLTCGTCAGLCPISGVDGLDPRKIVRMAVLGLDEQLVQSDWPWKCTMCGKCEEACPVNIEFVSLIRKIRGARKRSEVPVPIHRGVTMCLERGNNLGIPKDDFVFLCEDLGAELSKNDCQGFKTPIDVHGARVLVTVNSKIPYGEPEELKWWWRIFYLAGESWTIPSENWDGVNWGLFSGDDEAMKTVVGRLVDNMRRLNCKVLLLPESGHAYFAARLGLNKWFPEALKEFRIVTIFDLLLEYIESGRIRLDRGKHQMPVTYHDSCNYGRKSLKAFGQTYIDEARKIIRACCDDYRDMNPEGNSGYCCGAGGGVWAMPFAEERVFYGRIKARQITESGARLVIVPCQNCRDQILKSLNKEYDLNVEVKYIWELVADSLLQPGKK